MTSLSELNFSVWICCCVFVLLISSWNVPVMLNAEPIEREPPSCRLPTSPC